MAGLGPFALLWVGTASFLMSSKSGAVLDQTPIWQWGIIYPVLNILMIVLHYHLSPPMYAWLAVAPLRPNPIDSATPWAAAGKKTSAGGDLIRNEDDNLVVFAPQDLNYAADDLKF